MDVATVLHCVGKFVDPDAGRVNLELALKFETPSDYKVQKNQRINIRMPENPRFPEIIKCKNTKLGNRLLKGTFNNGGDCNNIYKR